MNGKGGAMAWFPGEELIKKMWETLADKGVGNLLRPWQMRREGAATLDVKRAEIIGIAEAERQAEEIRKGAIPIPGVAVETLMLPAPELAPEAGKPLPLPPPNPAEVALRASVADGIRREANVARAIVYAEQELAGDSTPPPDKSIDEDWLYRWRDYAAQVSTEQLQSMWGKLLAGEVKRPARYSLRTLEFLRNLSSDEAKLIEALAPFVVDDTVLKVDPKMMEDAGVSFSVLLALQDLGLISGVESVGLSITFGSDIKERYTKVLIAYKRALIIQHEDPDKKLQLGAYAVTSIGKQILDLGTFAPNENYLRKLGEDIAAKGFNVEIADVTARGENMIHVQNRQKIEPQKAGSEVAPPSTPAQSGN
jgi:hypothetical protein